MSSLGAQLALYRLEMVNWLEVLGLHGLRTCAGHPLPSQDSFSARCVGIIWPAINMASAELYPKLRSVGRESIPSFVPNFTHF